MTTTNARHDLIKLREDLWYPEPTRQALLAELYALATDPVRQRTRSMAIIADSNGGKSALVNAYMRLHPQGRDEQALIIPAVHIDLTDMTQVAQLSVALLKALGAPDESGGTHITRMDRFIALARAVKLQLVFLDEFHDCADTSGRGKPFLRCIKGLINQGLKVVPVGIEDVAEVLGRDPQLASRINLSRGRLRRLDQTSDLPVIRRFMHELSGLNGDDISDAAVEYVWEETRGILGHILDLIEGTVSTYQDLTLAHLRTYRATMDALDWVDTIGRQKTPGRDRNARKAEHVGF
ncbi:hypothetical protein GCM10022631_29880 [Deinococcus rubellus]|uniref:TniB family NTP-binding protein n=1 Tax=Deinococcus rubellus TaxID=1889240 RepID=UPI0031EF46D5